MKWPLASVLTILEKFFASMRTSAPLTGRPAGSFTTPSRTDVPAKTVKVTSSEPTKLRMNDFENIVGHFSAFLLTIQRRALPPNDIASQTLLPLHLSFCWTTLKNEASGNDASGSVFLALRIVTIDPRSTWIGLRPSKVRKTGYSGSLASISIIDPSAMMIDRFVRTCGQIGVITKTPDSGSRIGPPADNE